VMRSVLVTPAKAGAQSVAPANAGAQSVTPAKAGAQSVAPAKAGAQFPFLPPLCLAPCTSFASALDDFLAFNTATKTATAHFEQQVIDRSGKVTDRASGEFAFARPGKFRWVYEKPHKQLLVADGTRLYIHDPDLNQVTVKRMEGAISSTPAALLAGKDDITALFTLRDAGSADGLNWVEASPKETELTYVQPGQPVIVTVDTYPDVEWHGVVASISPASGSSFSMLPAQNTTGNWVKVVQRIPMIVNFTDLAGKPQLRVGMSVIVSVDTGHTRGLPTLISKLLDRPAKTNG